MWFPKWWNEPKSESQQNIDKWNGISDQFQGPRMPGTENEPIDEDDASKNNPDRKLTKREAKKMMRDIKTIRGGGAGIPATWMFKQIQDLTLAEAIAMHKAIQSGQSWGDIQKQGLTGDEGELKPGEYETFFGNY